MMSLFLLVLGVMLFLVLLMSVGVLLGRKPIAGSCGGMSALGMEVACEICGGDKQRCATESEKAARVAQSGPALAHDAMADRKPAQFEREA